MAKSGCTFANPKLKQYDDAPKVKNEEIQEVSIANLFPVDKWRSANQPI